MKIKILKKNILKEENCGGSAPPMGMTPSEKLPVVMDAAQTEYGAAYDAGWNDAIKEIMAVITEMMPGAIPVDMALPADIAHMDQLEE